MITNFYTLFHLATELDREFAGYTIDEIFTQNRNELILSFQETSVVIIVGCEPSNNYVYARKTFARANKNSVNLFVTLSGASIEKIFMDSADRQIHIGFRDTRELVMQVFGSKANVQLLDAYGTIVETFLKKPELKDKKLELMSETQFLNTPELLRDSIITTYKDQPIMKALKQMLPRFGSVLIRELLARTGLDGMQLVSSLKESEIDLILNNIQNLTKQLLSHPSPRIYSDGTLPVRFSIIPLQHLQELTFQNFDSVSEGIQVYRAALYHKKNVLREKEEITKVLKREQEHAGRTLKKISAEVETPNRIMQYEKFGKLLMAQLHLVKKGDVTACVEDFIGKTNDIIEIPLDVHLTPAKNAERYFEKAKKSQRASEEQHQRIAQLTQQQKSISQLIERLEETASADDLHEFIEENKKALAQFGLKLKKTRQLKKEESVPFRVFTVAGGFQVWAGKSGENNDLLSTRHTAKNDLWFHARGVGGSHVVLKVGTGKGEVSRQAIEQAAGIAAYYSKMKKSKLVPVTMCEGKYVRKPKGVPAGTVTVEREKTIFAEPSLPPSS